MNDRKKFLGWFSCGVTSAVACKVALECFGSDVELIYFETGAAHPDNTRFIAKCEDWYGREIRIERSPKFSCPLDVAKKYLFNTPEGAPCSLWLKKKVRQLIEDQYEHKAISVFGFEYSKKEANRAFRWKEQNHHRCYFPLIEHGLTKSDCMLKLEKAKIELPAMYKLGYNNNNCIGCFKGGMGYWNKIRRDFPNVFDEVAKVERERKSTCLKDENGQIYLDTLKPTRGRHKSIDIPSCDLFCDLEMGLKTLEIEEMMDFLTFKP